MLDKIRNSAWNMKINSQLILSIIMHTRTLKVTLSVISLSVLTRECWRESCTGDISGSEGRLLVMISLGVPVPASFTAVTWKL